MGQMSPATEKKLERLYRLNAKLAIIREWEDAVALPPEAAAEALTTSRRFGFGEPNFVMRPRLVAALNEGRARLGENAPADTRSPYTAPLARFVADAVGWDLWSYVDKVQDELMEPFTHTASHDAI